MAMDAKQSVAVYFVASPLNYLAARRVMLDHEAGARQVLVCYRPALRPMVDSSDWDAVVHMPWPRFDPLPGILGRMRRTLDNLRLVAAAVGPCLEIHLHSPVFDTEAVNYFISALPKLTAAPCVRVRILPDGVNSLRRQPLRLSGQLAMQLRRLRGLVSPLLKYTAFSGDRTGADADFVDRIYVLHGFEHEYESAKVVTLGPLISAGDPVSGPGAPAERRALVLGQPLLGHRQITESQRQQISSAIASWLSDNRIDQVFYKAHPRESGDGDFWSDHYHRLEIQEALESHFSHTSYDVVIGVCSTALFTARQIQGDACHVVAVGVDLVQFANPDLHENIIRMMRALKVERIPA
jgi:Alpha-2,8-polysialyltransferase (POLYST)